MLKKNELKKLALNECAKMIGDDFISGHKDKCAEYYGYADDNHFKYALCIDTKDNENFIIGANVPFNYYARVLVNVKTGEVTRDYENSVLPSM